MTLTMPDTNTEEEVFTFFDQAFDGIDTCEWQEGCKNETAWLVLCAECGSGEAVCTPHIMELKEAISRIDFQFTFNRTCNHNVNARDCPIIPKA